MKILTHFILFFLLPYAVIAQSQPQRLNALPLDPELDFKDICMMATSHQFAISETVAKEDLSKIFSSLGIAANNIEVIKCDKLKNSALAYYDDKENHYYILVNEDRLTNLTGNYYAHLFVVAHELGHIMKKHLGQNTVITQPYRRAMELEADTYAASIVKKLGGTVDACNYALQQMIHPADDTYADHPTLEKRIEAVKKGFETTDAPVINKNGKDYLPDLNIVGLIEYAGSPNMYDINAYSKETGLIPSSVVYFKDKYWIYWKKDEDVQNYRLYWNYDKYPDDTQTYFDQGYNIEFMEKVNDKWFLVMFKRATQLPQYTRILPKQNLQANLNPYLEKGYAVQNIINYDFNNYMFLLTKKDNYSLAAWTLSPTYADFEKWYKQKNNEGHTYMYCMKYINNLFFSFMTNMPEVSSWSVTVFNGSDASNLTAMLNQGYKIDNITCDEWMRFTLHK
ncbi:M48 family metalloprotease [Mucilaginibacter sp. UYCu711]|uniref:M48 family metalloprotease n=1 Tax=Mucilaginibacter sp. UYCu711 TaxID=3156339 RepID=UPI003D1F772F